MSQPSDGSAWIGVGLTALAGLAAAVKAFFSLATKDELRTALHELDLRQQKKTEEVTALLLRLHDENRQARKELGDQLSGPLLSLTKELGELRGELRARRNDHR